MSHRAQSPVSRKAGAVAAVMAIALSGVTLPARATGLPDEPGSHDGLFVVEDALAQFGSLKHHSEALAWRNDESAGAIDPSIYDHYQGITRYPGTGTPVFYVTQSDNDDAGSSGGYIHVVRMGSRDTDGERLRSNLQVNGSDTEDVTPAATDTWVRSIRIDGTDHNGVSLDAFKHPGGPAVIDDVLLVPVDQPEDEDNSPVGMILLFDLSADKESPDLVQAIELTHGIDNIGVTKNPDGSYLLWTNGDGGDDINIYTTGSGVDLSGGAVTLTGTAWSPDSGLTGTDDWPTGSGAHQSATFLREPDGSLFLVGMRHPGGMPSSGSDYADLYEVSGSGASTSLAFQTTIHQYCVYDGGGGPADMRTCNFAAATGGYVSPSGELILYALPHDDEDGFNPDIVRMAEFRHRDVSRPGSPLRAPAVTTRGPYSVDEGSTVSVGAAATAAADRPWVELYDDDGFDDRSIVVDYDDRALLELDNFENLDGFGDKTSSVRWRAPVGVDVHLFENDTSGGRTLVLKGTGQTQAISDLNDQVVVTGVVEHLNPVRAAGEDIDFGGKTSSLAFVGSPASATPALEWDLDGDGVFGETGPSALRGAETGATPTFDASAVDGPDEIQITARTVGGAASDATTIIVRNVAPGARLSGHLETDEGAEYSLRVDVTDPAAADVVDLNIDWGDGTTEEIALGTARSRTLTHTYADDDPTGTPDDQVTISVTPRDDDGGQGDAATGDVTVHNVDPAVTIDSLADETGSSLLHGRVLLNGLRADLGAGVTDAGQDDTHAATVDWGDGTVEPLTVASMAGSHVWTTPGDRVVSVTVVDDDTGSDTAQVVVTVVDAAGAAEAVVDELRSLLAEGGLDPDDAALIQEAIDELIGDDDGNASNGAISLLDADNTNAALQKYQHAIEALQSVDDPDTADLQSLLALAVKSEATAFVDTAAALADSALDDRRVDRAQAHLADADEHLAAGARVDAVESWQSAVRAVQPIID